MDITNLHAAGTTAMMKAALEGLTREDGTRPLLIAVTQLTSTDQAAMESDLLIHEPIDEVVMHYAETAKTRVWTAWSALLWKRGRCMSAAVSTFSP